MELILLGIISALCVGLIVALVQEHKHINRVEGEIKALTAVNTDLRKQNAKDYEDFRHALNQARAYYDEYIERKKQAVGKVDWSHDKEWEKGMNDLFEEWEKAAKSSYAGAIS